MDSTHGPGLGAAWCRMGGRDLIDFNCGEVYTFCWKNNRSLDQ